MCRVSAARGLSTWIMLNEGFSTEHFEKPNEFWLIDMAVAERSAYWENRPSKLALETVPEKED